MPPDLAPMQDAPADAIDSGSDAGIDRAALAAMLANTRRALLAERNAAGHWEGELSSSALSTATAMIALHCVDAAAHRSLIDGGRRWLVEHANAGGGWGDTTLSFSNISTTLLARAALSLCGENGAAAQEADRWIAGYCGSAEPAAVARTVAARYGKDRTFSVPILMACAIGGLLDADPRAAWRRVLPLPFELAVFPRSWFGALRLPVVSYALPALIAIGYARFFHAPPPAPYRRVRRAAWPAASRLLEAIQPSNGGFLEATPLTSFVTMALATSCQGAHPAVDRGVGFLKTSVRADGSWPIDTNLATWATTLAVKGIDDLDHLPGGARAAIRDWLLGQHYRVTHPFTDAPPGGWAWTDLPGGVPDADDTPGALLALHRLQDTASAAACRDAAIAGVAWLLDRQNTDGGIPTFCRGWGKLPFDRSSPDITAHTLRAWSAWEMAMPPHLRARVRRQSDNAAAYLLRAQNADGSWHPLWFGNQHRRDEANPTYGTAHVVLALLDRPDEAPAARRGTRWLLDNQNADGGWGAGEASPSTIEESALAIEALAEARKRLGPEIPAAALQGGLRYLIEATANGANFPAAPIGFYFAKLWYFEKLYPLAWTMAALRRLAEVE
ncbi:MAG: prenyltransferase/squalene oxidase repeat-containing protein [Verrucomicrobiales bacterium]